MFIDFIHFLAHLLLAGVLIRLVESKMKDNALGKALAFAY